MGSITALWLPVVILSHAFGLLCLALGPARMWLNARGGTKAFLARRRGSIPGKLPQQTSADEVEEAEEPLELDAVTRPAYQHGTTDTGPSKGSPTKGSGTSKEHPVERVNLEWQNICCSYAAAHGKVNILHDIWGKAAAGEMQALMGPSGAGKSTLMDILAQRKTVGYLSGFLLVNGQPATDTFLRKTAYVPQEDNFVATMTSTETLNFYASITLPNIWSKSDRKQRVVEVLTAMGLKHRQKTMVGGTLPGGLLLRGLSGGERKRLSIAAGILATPSIIFLDEPTSGLDSFAALSVMGYLKRMARDNGHAVIASIHQPRAAIWNMFDKVTLVASGRLMYYGPPDELVPWFDHLGYKYDAAIHGVASDWALDLVAIGFQKPVSLFGHSITSMEQLQAASVQFVSNYRALSGAVLYRDGSTSMMIGTKSLKHRVRARMQKYSGTAMLPGAQQPGLQVYVGAHGSVQSSDGVGPQVSSVIGDPVGTVAADEGDGTIKAPESVYATGWWRQFTACYGRELLAITRNPADVAGRIMTFTWVGILTGILFYNLPGDASSLQRRLNLVFSNLAFLCLMPYISMSLYTADKKFYLADCSAQLYRTHAYYAAKVAATMPFNVLAALVFSFTVYGMAGLRPGAKYIWQHGVLNTLLSLISVQIMHGCAILAPNQDAGFMLSICWTAIQLLMSNFFITFASVKLYGITELRYISALFYTFEGVTQVEFANKYFRCNKGMDDDTIATLRQLLPRTKMLNTPLVVNALKNPGSDCLADSNAVLKVFNYTRSFEDTFGILMGYLVGTHILTYVWMIIVARHEQR